MRSKTLLLSFFLLVIWSCTRVSTEYWPNGNVKSTITLKGSKYNGPAAFYYEDGTIQMECNYRNNLLDGRLIRYYSTGMKKEETIYKENKTDSIYRFWDFTGNILVEAKYSDSLLNGPYREYYSGGGLKTEGRYVKGSFDGKWLWYDEDGLIVGTADYVAGTGTQRSFAPGGGVLQIIRFRDNLKDGPEEYYNDKGELTEVRTYSRGELKEVKMVKKNP
jgi:antitoxin component YwqK of YwqJK toxin-antitoxin module